MQSAIALLKLALALLIAVQSPNIPADLRANATQVAQQAITAANTAILSSPLPATTIDPLIVPAPSINNVAPEVSPIVGSVDQTVAAISILDFGYFKSKIDAPHCTAPLIIPSADRATTDCQVVNLAVYIYDTNGKIVRNLDLTASTTDAGQNKVIHGTGISQGYYAFPYLFRNVTNQIEFTAGSGDQTITLTATP